MDTRSKVGKQIGKKADICGSCSKEVLCDCIQCEGKCGRWFHAACSGLSDLQFKDLAENEDSKWSCQRCSKEEKSNEDGDENPIAEAIRKLRRQVEENIQPSIPTPATPTSNIEDCCWGNSLKGNDILKAVNDAYSKTIKWKINLFKIPSGKSGKGFIEEMSKIVGYYINGTGMEEVAIKLLMIMPPLLLQKPSKKSKTKMHVEYLEKRLKWWTNGDLLSLLREGMEIQRRLTKGKKTEENKEKVFVRLMLQGKVSNAMRWIGSQATSVLDVTPDVVKTLQEKHPPPAPVGKGSLLLGAKQNVEDVIYENIDGDLIELCARKMSGSAGPSGLDADGWKRILCSKQFSSKSKQLAENIAAMARKLCTKNVIPEHLEAYTACRLIPLDKKPGVRPVGIGEVLRRIIGKAISRVLQSDMVGATAPIQVCAGLSGGVEAAVHGLRRIFNDDETEAIILVDADNAFNRLNRTAALHNIQFICPEIATYLINTYRNPARLFISNSDKELLSEEGVTQGDNCAMGKYSCSLMPLVQTVAQSTSDASKVKQVWYADDAAGGGKLDEVLRWWERLNETGPLFGYYPKPAKTWLIVKPHCKEKAEKMFPDLQISEVGHRYLGSFIGTEEGTKSFLDSKVDEWINDIEDLADIAKREPQAAYSAFNYGLSKRWNYVCRTTPGISQHLRRLEYKIQESFIPAILDRSFGTDQTSRKLFALPVKEGGLGIYDLSLMSDLEYEYSCKVTLDLTEAIYNQHPDFFDDQEKLVEIKTEIRKSRMEFFKERKEEVTKDLNETQKLQLDLTSEKGASSWLSSLPLKSFGFCLNKQEFNDALALRYNFGIKDAARKCVCGSDNSINHSLICKRGGYVSLRHNSLRDVLAELLETAGCKDVTTEPLLIPVNGRELPAGANKADGARLDVSARSVWNPLERAFFRCKSISCSSSFQ